MADTTPITGEALIKACANKIVQRDGNKANIEQRQRQIVHYSTINDQLQAEIEAMQGALASGQPYTPPPAK